MKKSFFDGLDSLIEQAVFDATDKEVNLQNDQAKKVKSSGLSKKDNKKSDVDESDEDLDKIDGGPKKTSASDKSSKDSKSPGTKTSKKILDPTEEELKNPQYNDIEKKINGLRGGSSLKKSSISSSLKDYLGSLSTPEKSALLTYLTDLAQIMAPVKSGKDVDDPSEVGLEITFKNTEKSTPKTKTKDKGSDENKQDKSSKDSVIVVGK